VSDDSSMHRLRPRGRSGPTGHLACPRRGAISGIRGSRDVEKLTWRWVISHRCLIGAFWLCVGPRFLSDRFPPTGLDAMPHLIRTQ